MEQEEELLRIRQETAEKVAAMAFAQANLAALVPSVLSSLSDRGYFIDHCERGQSVFYGAKEILDFNDILV